MHQIPALRAASRRLALPLRGSGGPLLVHRSLRPTATSGSRQASARSFHSGRWWSRARSWTSSQFSSASARFTNSSSYTSGSGRPRLAPGRLFPALVLLLRHPAFHTAAHTLATAGATAPRRGRDLTKRLPPARLYELKADHYRRALLTESNDDVIWNLYKKLHASRSTNFLTRQDYVWTLHRLWNPAVLANFRLEARRAASRSLARGPSAATGGGAMSKAVSAATSFSQAQLGRFATLGPGGAVNPLMNQRIMHTAWQTDLTSPIRIDRWFNPQEVRFPRMRVRTRQRIRQISQDWLFPETIATLDTTLRPAAATATTATHGAARSFRRRGDTPISHHHLRPSQRPTAKIRYSSGMVGGMTTVTRGRLSGQPIPETPGHYGAEGGDFPLIFTPANDEGGSYEEVPLLVSEATAATAALRDTTKAAAAAMGDETAGRAANNSNSLHPNSLPEGGEKFPDTPTVVDFPHRDQSGEETPGLTGSAGPSSASFQPSRPSPDDCDWVLELYIRLGLHQDAVDLAHLLAQRQIGFSTSTLNWLMLAYRSRRNLVGARALLQDMLHAWPQVSPNARTYRIFIGLLVQCGEFEEAWSTLEDLQALTQSPETHMAQVLLKGMQNTQTDETIRQFCDNIRQRSSTHWSHALATNLIEMLSPPLSTTKTMGRSDMLGSFTASGHHPHPLAANLDTAVAVFHTYRLHTPSIHASVFGALLRLYNAHDQAYDGIVTLRPLIDATFSKEHLGTDLACELMSSYAAISDHKNVYLLYRNLIQHSNSNTGFVTLQANHFLHFLHCFATLNNMDLVCHALYHLSGNSALATTTHEHGDGDANGGKVRRSSASNQRPLSLHTGLVNRALELALTTHNSGLLPVFLYLLELNCLPWNLFTYELVMRHYLQSGNTKAAHRYWRKFTQSGEPVHQASFAAFCAKYRPIDSPPHRRMWYVFA
ncbi:hypothetical protein H4R33_006446 [Dimargaris cristalligena]|uniref:Pentacotripeptide-repeat region of PRORP domain-containing protein n=1 Tax=Dimargaris cristalligena TaxID=215637 RepID=A0A4P9ZMS1_9FUNG|nr:hypothetical protein H4R33_006446 [Dimargaris cristalligena]RKP33822.1 hypothetical protein BJ085DRAFT_39761 [Dimargaris cristalligena]|eukprot:RKP33822.1 hypothetical protein BJ085DRAFT_39761 [Dimargaris cristalligena]